jgi:hypothetical protein
LPPIVCLLTVDDAARPQGDAEAARDSQAIAKSFY